MRKDSTRPGSTITSTGGTIAPDWLLGPQGRGGGVVIPRTNSVSTVAGSPENDVRAENYRRAIIRRATGSRSNFGPNHPGIGATMPQGAVHGDVIVAARVPTAAICTAVSRS